VQCYERGYFSGKIAELKRELLKAHKALVKDKADHRTQTEAERKAHQEEMIVSIVQTFR